VKSIFVFFFASPIDRRVVEGYFLRFLTRRFLTLADWTRLRDPGRLLAAPLEVGPFFLVPTLGLALEPPLEPFFALPITSKGLCPAAGFSLCGILPIAESVLI